MTGGSQRPLDECQLGQDDLRVLPEVQPLARVDRLQFVRRQQADQCGQPDPHLIEQRLHPGCVHVGSIFERAFDGNARSDHRRIADTGLQSH